MCSSLGQTTVSRVYAAEHHANGTGDRGLPQGRSASDRDGTKGCRALDERFVKRSNAPKHSDQRQFQTNPRYQNHSQPRARLETGFSPVD